MKPQLFDILGIVGFAFITAAALWSKISKKPLSKTMTTVLLIIGLAGLVVDAVVVYRYYTSI